MSRRRRAGRWAGVVLIVCGALLLAEVAVTVLWQEPFAALRERDRTDDARAELRALTAAPSSLARGLRGQVRVAAEAGALRRAAGSAKPVGEIVIPRLKLHGVLFNGSSSASLARGPALYDGSPFPGEVGTVAIGGHRTTHGAPFRDVDRLRPGDRVTLILPYARFTYAVKSTRIVAPGDVGVLRGQAGERRLVLSACHPRYSASQRFVVIATPTDVMTSADSRPVVGANGRESDALSRYSTI